MQRQAKHSPCPLGQTSKRSAPSPCRALSWPPSLSLTTLSWDPPELTEVPLLWPKGQGYSLSCHHIPTSWCQHLVGGGASAKANTPDPAWSLKSSTFSGSLAEGCDCSMEKKLWLKASKTWTFGFTIPETFQSKILLKNMHLLGYY